MQARREVMWGLDRLSAGWRLAVMVVGSGWFWTGTAAGLSGSPPEWPEDVVVNAGGSTYDYRPSVATGADGSLWMAWHAYRLGSDRIVARRLGPQPMGPTEVLSQRGDALGGPVVAAGEGGSVWVFWAARPRGQRWRIVGRRWSAQKWQPAVMVSGPEGDAIWPAAMAIDQGKVLVTWCSFSAGRFGVRGRLFDGTGWHEPMTISPGSYDAFRSTIAVGSRGQAWVFWDTYQRDHYSVMGRRVLPQRGPVEPVSPPGRNCLTPVSLSAASGPCVAWLQVVDVVGGAGVISQWYTLHVAMRGERGWRLVTDEEGRSAGATLTYGLIARMEPKPVATGGYLGRRRHPVLLEDGRRVWLLWERKADHRGRTPETTGELIGRPIEGGRWQEPVVLDRGLLDYHLVQPARARGGRFLYVASQLPRRMRRIYRLKSGDLRRGSEFAQEDWPGWKPVSLPLPDTTGPRYEIQVGRKRYRLWWADLHCHTGLTADAEGEPDELLHYARDRAQLDVVVLTENDTIYDCPLTEGEFALDHLLSNAFSRTGRFLALPGYEWTSRLPRSSDVHRADPRNWDAAYWRESFPNHRTVIYPPAGGPVVRHPEVENDIARLNQAAARAGGLTLTQHATWVLTGHPVEVGVEATSGWSIYIRNPERLHRALADGFRVGLVGCGDSHRRNPGLCGGLTGIYAERLTPEAILDALRHRRMYATNGSRIFLDARANGVVMGQQIRAPQGDVELTLKVIGTRPLTSAVLIRDGQPIRTVPGDGTRRLEVTHRDTKLPAGNHWYYWRITQGEEPPSYPGNLEVAQGHLAWSSPHWVVVP